MKPSVASLGHACRSALEKTLGKVVHFYRNFRYRVREIGHVLTQAILRGQSIHAICEGYKLRGGLPDGSDTPDDDILYYRLE